ncbi:MAG: HAMP domain-containing histidine kinase [Chloroflexi bacterium]|nr:HAMP domain-containing histidine kinase [Chloroflexota bacterium]
MASDGKLSISDVWPLQEPSATVALDEYVDRLFRNGSGIDSAVLNETTYAALPIRIYDEPVGVWVIEPRDDQNFGAQAIIAQHLVKYLGNHIYWARLIQNFESRFLEELSRIDHTALAREQMLVQQTRTKTLYDFIEMSSHDFRTPLTAIQAATYNLRRTEDPVKQAQKLDTIESAAANLDHKFRQVSLIIKLRQPEIDDFSLRLCTAEEIRAYVEGSVIPKLLQNDVLIQIRSLQSCDERSSVSVDLIYLGLAVQNVLDNALRYARERVQLGLGCDGPDLLIRVDDDGPGMTAEEVVRVFEPMFRAESHRPQNAGLGLGLPITRAIVEHMQGSIALRSSPSGTSVEIRLPTRSNEKPRRPTEAE